MKPWVYVEAARVVMWIAFVTGAIFVIGWVALPVIAVAVGVTGLDDELIAVRRCLRERGEGGG